MRGDSRPVVAQMSNLQVFNRTPEANGTTRLTPCGRVVSIGVSRDSIRLFICITAVTLRARFLTSTKLRYRTIGGRSSLKQGSSLKAEGTTRLHFSLRDVI